MKKPFKIIAAIIVVCEVASSVVASSASSGNVDPAFDPGDGPNGDVYCVATQPDNKVLIGGNFTFVNDASRNHIARLNADGTLDESFDPGTGANDFVTCVVPLSDGRALVGGIFTSFNETTRRQVARLNSNGSLDTSFDPGSGPGGEVLSLVVQPDGKVLVAGTFHSVYRLNTDGSLDSTFNSGAGANSVIYSAALQSDGKLLVGGAFSMFNGMPRSRVARLNANGSLDDTFFPGTGPNAEVLSIVIQSDNKAIIGGNFTTYNSKSRNRVARLNSDGTPDATFYPAGGANSTVQSVALDSSGKVLIGGDFVSFNGTPRNRIARLTAAGILDAGFDPGSGADALVRAVTIDHDGRAVIGGSFTSVNNIPRSHVARLAADPVPWLTIALSGPDAVLSWPTNFSGFTLQSTASLNPPVSWTNSTTPVAISGSQYMVTNRTSAAAQFYRLKK